jgi:hypothetical protein
MKIKDGRKKCWRTTITYDGKAEHLGNFYTEIEAAMAYNDAAKDLYQEFALINTFEDEDPKEVQEAQDRMHPEDAARPDWGTKTFTVEDLIPPWEREEEEDGEGTD